MPYGTVTDWLVAVGTLVLATVAVFQDSIRRLLYSPKFGVSIKNEPPDCVAIQGTSASGHVADSVYLRLWVENTGNTAARNAEVYARELRRRYADTSWHIVPTFPPMNLRWANVSQIYFPSIAPGMGKHCDLGHIVDPALRHLFGEEAPALGLTQNEASLAFDLMVAPNHRGHIIGPGEYQLDIYVAAENARPVKTTITIILRGPWYPDETTMLRDGVGVSVR